MKTVFHILGFVPPSQDAIVANEGLGLGSPTTKNGSYILVVTSQHPGQGGNPVSILGT